MLEWDRQRIPSEHVRSQVSSRLGTDFPESGTESERSGRSRLRLPHGLRLGPKRRA